MPPPPTPIDPDELLEELLEIDEGLSRERYWGERSIFYNPGRVKPLGKIWVSIKDHDGENDSSSKLDRAGVFRFAFCLSQDAYAASFGDPPARPAKGAVVALPSYDPTRLGELMPHPVYAWMRWVQILSPTRADLDALRPSIEESLELIERKWKLEVG